MDTIEVLLTEKVLGMLTAPDLLFWSMYIPVSFFMAFMGICEEVEDAKKNRPEEYKKYLKVLRLLHLAK